ncbi:glycosyltransferase [Streptomyces sp. CA-132043]|uniref:glycosyltransferase n=1 Tax=Streptomyces sp. CA-132043 TaxID=3240048 RepID=UPI003D949B3C
MIERYADHRPVAELAVHLGLHEEEPAATAGSDLVWLGRIDEEKAPHIAIRAAQILGRRIRIVGPVFDETYVRRHDRLFSADHVKWVGELGGPAKTAALREGSVFVYTYARTYVEAGAAVFGESLRAGTPMAALTWREGTCAQAALCDQTGVVTVADPREDDETAAELLALAIEQAEDLNHTEVQEIGLQRFDPARHFAAMASRPC